MKMRAPFNGAVLDVAKDAVERFKARGYTEIKAKEAEKPKKKSGKKG